jgi:hypothetical protein
LVVEHADLDAAVEGGLSESGWREANKRGGKPDKKRLAHAILPDDAFYVGDLSVFSVSALRRYRRIQDRDAVQRRSRYVGDPTGKTRAGYSPDRGISISMRNYTLFVGNLRRRLDQVCRHDCKAKIPDPPSPRMTAWRSGA